MVLDPDLGCLVVPFTDYINGARQYLEAEGFSDNLKDSVPSVREIKIHFAAFIRHLIRGFPRKYFYFNVKTFFIQNCYFSVEKQRHLLKKDLRNNLFYLFAGWSGKFGQAFDQSSLSKMTTDGPPTEFEYSALESMISVLCCGPFFNESALSEDGPLYQFLDSLLESKDSRVSLFFHFHFFSANRELTRKILWR